MSGPDTSLAALLTREALRDLAGNRSFERGERYAEDGLVHGLRATARGIAAKVDGTRAYRVKLEAVDGEIVHHCTCPVAMDGPFCKHCVAVGLAWLADRGDAPHTRTAGGELALEGYLLSLDKRELVSLLLEQAESDDRLLRRLETRSARAAADGPDLSIFRRAFDDALATGRLVDWGEMHEFGSGVDEVVDSLADLLGDGRAEAVIELAEYGLDAVERVIQNVDDSAGWMGGLLDRLQELHLAACIVARPDPVELAGRLFETQMESSYGVFHRAAETYGEVLGPAGLAEYRRLAEADWATVPALGPNDKDDNRYGLRQTITSVMESLARVSGDLEALVAVKSRDLSMPWDFLDIAQVYLEAGREDEALDWAERGFRAFPDDRRDGRLREFVADIYHARDRHDEAMALTWEAFADHPSFEMYQGLETHAGKAGAWPAWRERALAHIRDHLDGRSPPRPKHLPPWYASAWDGSVLVRIFLHERDTEAAWREARTRGCSDGLWLELAKCRETPHPSDSIAIYRKHIDGLLHNTGATVYEETVRYLDRIRELQTGSDGADAFTSLVRDIRITQKRKRNLMKLLDIKGW